MNDPVTPALSSAYPSPRYAWTLVGFLTLAYVSSFLDRWILGLLVDPIKESTGASDTQMGFLSSAFTWIYALFALPLGFLVDRANRTRLVAIGIAVWSAATIWTGTAKSFVSLFAARASVGVGEAVLSPAAFSMIGDSFPRERRGLPIAIYSMALVIGASIANLMAAGILAWAESISPVSLPIVGAVEDWQLIFIIVGLPGFLLAAIFLFFREPARIESSPREGASLGDAFTWIQGNAAAFFTFVPIFMCMVAVAYGQFFNAAMFGRTFGWDPKLYATVNGLSILAISPATYIFAGRFSDKRVAAGDAVMPLKLAILGLFIMIPTAVVAPLLPAGWMAFGMFCFTTVGIGLVSAPGVNALLVIVPGDVRGVVVAVYYFFISFIGGALSPPLIGWINDTYFAGESLRSAMAIYPVLFGLPVMLIVPWTLKNYRAALAKAA